VVNCFIFGIDPGSEQSAFVLYDSHDKVIVDKGIMMNHDMLHGLAQLKREDAADILAIEMIASYGMPVGREVFETCVWIGRFMQSFYKPLSIERIPRKDVKMHLCGSMRAKDANIRQSLIDKLGKEATKGVAKDMWSALAVAVYVSETHGG
jgi:hypothetical protein